MSKTKHVAILGAGPAGLSAGLELSREGVCVDILEQEAQVGGLCRSSRKDGFIFDLGGHRFITKDELVLTEVLELMKEQLLVRPRKSVIRLQEKFFNYPLEITDVLKKLKPTISLRAAFDFFLTQCQHQNGTPDSSFKQWIVKRFGRTMYDIYFGPYSEKLWGMPPDQISAQWAAQRISLVNITDVILRSLGKKHDTPKTYAQQFLYPKEGIGQICEYMADEITGNGGRVERGARVTRVLRKNGRIEQVYYEKDGREQALAADVIVSTIPLPEFVQAVSPAPDPAVVAVAKTMSFRSVLFVHLMLDREFVSDNTWIYVPEGKYVFFRIQDRRNWSPTAVPDGKNALTLEIACTRGDALWESAAEALVERCVADLEKLGLIRREQVSGYLIEKAEHAYPVYTIDYQEKVGQMYKYLSSFANLLPIGRQGLYRYNNMDHSIKMGILAAKHILHGYPLSKVFEIATENVIFDWQDPGYHAGEAKSQFTV